MNEKSIDDNNSYFVRTYVKRVQKVKIFIKGKNGHFERLQIENKP